MTLRPRRTIAIADAEYGLADHAGKYRSTAGTQPTIDPTLLHRCLVDLERDGYTIIEDAVDPDDLDRVRSEANRLFVHDGGRNAFEGFKTRRLYSPLEETDALDSLAVHPIALGLLDQIFEPNYLLSQLQIIDIAPGEAAQALHADDSFYPWPRPRPPLGAATIIAVDDFTTDNGATRVIPGSHRWGDQPPTPEQAARAIPAVMPAGSMLFFLGTTWHSGGENNAARSRMAVTAQYCAPWCRPQESFLLSVSRERVARSSEHLQRLLGYSIHPPFMGFVNGMHPKRLLEPLVEPAGRPDTDGPR
ncbi:MAG: phytanoyl-CoA dioxygenase family protein [Actinomycetota bacterium]